MAVVLFLDMFHGTPISFNHQNKDSIFFSWCTYLLAIVVALTWIFLTTISGYVGGTQSIDQVIFGSSLGFLLGLFSHFFMRDNLISYFERIIYHNDKSKHLLGNTNMRSEDFEVEYQQENQTNRDIKEVNEVTL